MVEILKMQHHTVEVTRTGWSFFGGKMPAVPIDLNVSFIQSTPGIFKLAHTALGLICLSVIAYYSQFFHPLTGSSLGLFCSNSAAYFLLVTYGCFVTSLVLLVCCLVSYFTASFLPKTAFEFAYHAFAFVTYLVSSLTLLLNVIVSNTDNGPFTEPAYAAKIAASIVGLVILALNGSLCQFVVPPNRHIGFVCGHTDTYMFVVSCYCFLTAALQMLSCATSQKTAILLFKSSYEFLLYLLNFALYSTSSVALIVNVTQRNSGYAIMEDGYGGTIATAVLGFVNGCFYGVSAGLTFFTNKDLSSTIWRR